MLRPEFPAPTGPALSSLPSGEASWDWGTGSEGHLPLSHLSTSLRISHRRHQVKNKSILWQPSSSSSAGGYSSPLQSRRPSYPTDPQNLLVLILAFSLFMSLGHSRSFNSKARQQLSQSCGAGYRVFTPVKSKMPVEIRVSQAPSSFFFTRISKQVLSLNFHEMEISWHFFPKFIQFSLQICNLNSGSY